MIAPTSPKRPRSAGLGKSPVRGGLPVTVPQTDPRAELSEQALVVASQNAFPIVATQKSRRDGIGLAAGAAVALVLGARPSCR